MSLAQMGDRDPKLKSLMSEQVVYGSGNAFITRLDEPLNMALDVSNRQILLQFIR